MSPGLLHRSPGATPGVVALSTRSAPAWSINALLENVRVGDGMDPATDMGPLIDKADVTRVDRLVQAALAYAKPVVRGGLRTDGALVAGAFYWPVLLLEVDDVGTDLVQKEVFGPVATFEVFDTETDALARANATEYGLHAVRRLHLYQHQHQPGPPRDPSRHRLDEHVGGDQRRLRRGRLQAKRHRPPARPPGHHRVPGSQDRRPRHSAVPGLTRPHDLRPAEPDRAGVSGANRKGE